MRINNPANLPYEDVEALGIVIKRVQDSDNQRHVGLLYKIDEKQQSMSLHLAWHYVLINSPPSDDYFWVDCGLDVYNKAALAAFCKTVYDVNRRDTIPYGIDLSGRSFDPITGRWDPGSSTDGLTCATFVMEIFSALGHDLFDKDTWERRASDEAWQAHIISTLVSNGADHQHVAAQIGLIGAFRFRPEEVAGAVPQEHYPVPFEDSVSYANEILSVI